MNLPSLIDARKSIATRLTLWFVLFGALPAILMVGVFAFFKGDVDRAFREPLHATAVAVGDVIDRNLFERYGDVQAFALNGLAHDPANWRRPGHDNPLVAAIDGYMANYGMYTLSILVDPQGQVLAVNSLDKDGKPLETAKLYPLNFANQPWFKDALAGKFLETKGLTGTVVRPPANEPVVAQMYGSDGYSIVFAAPVKSPTGKLVGVWANYADFGLVESIVAQFHKDLAKRGLNSSEITVLDPDGRVIVDYDPPAGAAKYRRDPAIIGKLNLVEKGVEAAVAAVRRGETGVGLARHEGKGIDQAVGYTKTDGVGDFPGLGWSVLVRVTDAQVTATSGAMLRDMLIALFVAVVAIAVVARMIGRGIGGPVAETALLMRDLAGGNDDIALPAAREDEIGEMLDALAELRKTVAEAFRLRQMVDQMPINVMTCDPRKEFRIDYVNQTSIATLRPLEKFLPIRVEQLLGSSVDIFHKNPSHQRRLLADPKNLPHEANIKLGDQTLKLSVSAMQDKRGSYIGPMLVWTVVTEQVRLAGRVKEVVGAVAAAATEMRSTAEAMTGTAAMSGDRANGAAAASEQASANVQSVASAAEQLSSSISEISRQVAQSARVAGNAVTQSAQASEQIQGLASASKKIGEVVSLISDIAAQTNLLALNATIEAARAGDAGKGFAVVASEVKALANQTAKATEEISSQIGSIQSSINTAVDAVSAISGTITEVSDISNQIAAAVEQQGAATAEISRNVQEAATGTREVSSNIADVSAAATETGQSASQVLDAAGELAQQATLLDGEVQQFLKNLGAA